MRLAFLGTPEVAATTLRALVAAGHEIPLVVTRPDKRRGRGGALSPSPVKQAAAELGLRVVHSPADLVGSGTAMGVVVGYGRIIKPDVLAEVLLVNIHFSLLPRWRGAAPVERALLAGDELTGASLMKLDEGLDTGPVFVRAETPIGPMETADELRQRLGRLGDELLLRMLHEGLPVPVPQVGEPTYASKLEPWELRLDFSQPAVVCNRVVRLGRAWTTWRGRRLLVRAALPVATEGSLSPGEIRGDLVGTAHGSLQLLVVQPEGKPAMDALDWVRGARLRPGEHLGD